MTETHTGFTGTRDGMTKPQVEALRAVMTDLTGWWAHGDCLGADEQSHAVALELGLRVDLHPSTSVTWRAWCLGAEVVHPPRDPLLRNRDIINASTRLIAAPSGSSERLRSGTWSTVRQARRLKLPVTLVFPDGYVQQEGRR